MFSKHVCLLPYTYLKTRVVATTIFCYRSLFKKYSPDLHFSALTGLLFQLETSWTVCSCHVTYAFQSESTLYSCLNVKALLARSRRDIWSLSDCNRTRTQNHLVRKRTINHLARPNGWVLVYELSGSGFESSCNHLEACLFHFSFHHQNCSRICPLISTKYTAKPEGGTSFEKYTAKKPDGFHWNYTNKVNNTLIWN